MEPIEVSTVINKPVKEVSDYFEKPENAARWAVGITDSRSDGPPGLGTKVFWKQTFLGMQNDWVMETTRFEPGKLIEMKSISGPFLITYLYTLEPVEGGTKMIAHADSKPGGFFKLAEPIVARVAKRQLRDSLENLKDLLEAEKYAAE